MHLQVLYREPIDPYFDLDVSLCLMIFLYKAILGSTGFFDKGFMELDSSIAALC